MKSIDRRAAALTVALHAAVVLPLPTCSVDATPPPVQRSAGTSEELVFVQISDQGTAPCELRYDGLGIMWAPDGRVIDVALGGPAWLAGIREDDYVEGLEDMYPNKYPAGTRIAVRGSRNGRLYTKTVTIGPVCQQ